MKPCPDVSIVIVSYNTRDLLEQCLRSVDESAGNVTLETFVVDNASADGSPDMVEEKFPHVRVIRNATNAGFASANNRAIVESEGRYVLLLNPDTIVLDGAIATTAGFMDEKPEAGIATCKILNADRSFQTCFADDFPNAWSIVTGGSSLRAAVASLFLSRRYLASSGVSPEDIDRAHPVAWVMGACMMIRRAVVDQVGLLDEKLFMYGEEPDYCYRARQAGWQMWYTPDGEVVHLGGESTKKVDQERLVDWLMTTNFHFFRKHRSRTYTFLCYWAALGSSVVKTGIYSLLHALPASDVKKQRRRDKLMQMRHTFRWCVSHGPFQVVRGAAG